MQDNDVGILSDKQDIAKDFNWSIWAPPVVLAAILLLFLVYLLIPGTLIYSHFSNTKSAVISEPVVQELEQNLNTQIIQLESMLDKGVCTENGLALPDQNMTFLPPREGSNNSEGSKILSLPPSKNLNAMEGDQEVSLSKYLQDRVVLILTKTGGLGTGFFINKNKIITNQHVVEDAGQSVRFIFPNSVQVHEASVLDMSSPFEATSEDYALLLSSQPNEKFLTVAALEDDLALKPVISAGFPGDVLETIDGFDRIGQGVEGQEYPLFLTNGTINAEKDLQGPGAIIIHSADISTGNSGGPLVNGCGHLIGINTFVKEAQYRTLNIALHASGLKPFLKKNEVEATYSSEPCSPKSRSSSENSD